MRSLIQPRPLFFPLSYCCWCWCCCCDGGGGVSYGIIPPPFIRANRFTTPYTSRLTRTDTDATSTCPQTCPSCQTAAPCPWPPGPQPCPRVCCCSRRAWPAPPPERSCRHLLCHYGLRLGFHVGQHCIAIDVRALSRLILCSLALSQREQLTVQHPDEPGSPLGRRSSPYCPGHH